MTAWRRRNSGFRNDGGIEEKNERVCWEVTWWRRRRRKGSVLVAVWRMMDEDRRK